jgi:bifunctional UDP-N-acetylglucosamine pyrophosphorylase/glucosamine-1-phosphate N-acetyltransferase
MPLEIIILAAGQGTRMRSGLPKVLHPVAARPMLAHVLETANNLAPSAIHVVIGHGAEQVKERIQPELAINWVVQEQQLGTGHAVDQAMPMVDPSATVLILYGDVPLIGQATLQGLIEQAQSGMALLTVMLEQPKGYGRILRNSQGRVTAIVEEKDANEAQRQIREGNSGILCCQAAALGDWLRRLDNDNAQGEYYLTDVIAMAVADGVAVEGVIASDCHEVAGINDRMQLAAIERIYQRRCAERLMQQGVSMLDPARFDLRGELSCGSDVEIDANVIIEGKVIIGNRVRIGANVMLKNTRIGDDVVIEPMSLIDGAEIGDGCQIGPFARLRPGSELAAKARIGNFVEVKKSRIGQGSKVNHLSYIGDTEMGAGVNIGAGTITCNYDGANKHQTIIGDNAFIGSDSQLVAPVSIGAGATIGAGSTITSDAPAGGLTLSRTKQRSL